MRADERGPAATHRGPAADRRERRPARPRLVGAVCVAAALIGATACARGPALAAPKDRGPFDFAGTACAASPPTKGCCEAAAKRAFARFLSEDDGTGEGRYGMPGEFDALAVQTLAEDPIRIHVHARGTVCEAVIPVPPAYAAIADETPSRAEAALRARAESACARATQAVAAAASDEVRTDAHRADRCAYGGDGGTPAECAKLLASSSPGALQVLACRDARAAVPVGVRTISSLVPAVGRVLAVEAIAARVVDGALARDRARAQAGTASEDPLLTRARAACNADVKACEAACEKADPWSCVTLAWDHLRTAKPPAYAKARALLVSACAAKVDRACAQRELLDAEAADYERRAGEAYGEVLAAAGEIALNLDRERKARAVPAAELGALARSLDRMQVYRDSVFVQRLCPAKRRFLAAFGERDLEERVERRCAHPGLPPDSEDPGHEESCRSVVARPCP